MMRRLNYTGRRRISRSRVLMRLTDSVDETYSFEAEFDLKGLRFPRDASVFVEAYNSASYMRFDFGTVGAPTAPHDRRLLEITRRPMPKFRLKVVDKSKRHGLLLGVADQLIPLRAEEEPEQRQSLLPVDFCDLGDRVWRLDLSDWPVLELNSRVENIGEAARSSGAFLGLVYPEVVRRVLHDIVIAQDIQDPQFDDSDWTSLWLRYACSLPGVQPPPAGSSDAAHSRQLDWVDTTVQAFCRSRQARRQLQSAISRELR